jgi:ferrochelatase
VTPPAPFDAVLLIAFGGPRGRDEIRPFLQNVLRGRRIPPERIEAVVAHYELFDGVSPINECTSEQASGLEARLLARGYPLPVYVGTRNWKPHLADTLAAMSRAGVRRAIGVIAAVHRSYSSCGQYRQNVWQAQGELRSQGIAVPAIHYVGDWHAHPRFIIAVADRVRAAARLLPPALAPWARLVFTAHSLPAAMPHADTYRKQFEASASLVAAELRRRNWALAYQSRSGRPDDPWLGPDINVYLRSERENGLQAVIVCPLGFVCDHIEVLYDLDREARETCDELGIAMARAEAVNAHPAFIDALADAVCETWDRYRTGIPVPLVDGETRDPREAGPPVRGSS